MDREDWTLVVLAAARGEVLTPVQLQKALFLVGTEFPDEVGDDFYRFSPYNYGPFSAHVYEDAESLEVKGLAEIFPVANRGWSQYGASPPGMDRADTLEVSPEVREYISELVDWIRKQSFSSLLRAIYREYPEYRANSIFQG